MAKLPVKLYRYRFLSAVLVIAGLGLCAIPAAGFGSDPMVHELLLETPPAAFEWEPVPTALYGHRSRQVALNPIFTHLESIAAGDRLVLNLFEDVRQDARVDRVTVNAMGTVTVRARLDNQAFSHAVITTTNGQANVLINIPETGILFQITPDSKASQYRLLETPSEFLDYLEPAAVEIPQFLAEASGPEAPAAFTSEVLPDEKGIHDPATIAVMVVYTPAASLWAATQGGMDNIIASAMANAQLVHDNSSTGVTFELVHSALVDYLESGNSYMDLDRLRSTRDGFMDEVHEWRDHYGADLVALFADVSDIGGLGYLLTRPYGDPAYAFSLTRIRQAATGFTHVHEMGHNMGLHHHKEQNQQPGPGLFSYSAGWRWTSSDDRKYCSVMTYGSGVYFADGITHRQVPHLSDPHTTYLGTPSGDLVDGDNARTVREVKHVITVYRTPPVLIPQIEREALIALYENTSGDTWLNNTGWKQAPLDPDGFSQPGTECDWHGITCSNDQVSRISLNYNQLIGTIPHELGNLGQLDSLGLNGNQLSGTIPPELGNLSQLRTLDLMSNQLTGAIPPELGDLANLIDLNLYSNQLTGTIPPDFGNLNHLFGLHLGSNQLSGTIPLELGNLANLRSLELDYNQLSGTIPSEFGNLNHLYDLHLGSNQLSGTIPLELLNLAQLVSLTLNGNQLSGTIPPELGDLAQLYRIDLSNNRLSGPIPPELGNLVNLSMLNLSHNHLHGPIPPELGRLRDLGDLVLSGNQLTGTIPGELGALGWLSTLYLNSNQLIGPIPIELTNLYELMLLNICNNYLYADDDGLRSFLNLFQSGWEACQYALPEFRFTPPSLSIPAAAGSSGIEVANSGGGTLNWTAEVIAGADWLSIASGSSGIDAGTVICTYHQNPAEERTGAIRFESLTGQLVDYPVNQAAVTHRLTTTAHPGGAGTVIRNPDQAAYSNAAPVRLTANPGLGYIFSHWSGDVGGPSNPITLSMDSAKNVTAHFILKGHPHAISASVGGEPLTVVTLSAVEQDFLLNVADGTRTLPEPSEVATVHFQNNTATLSYRDGRTRVVTVRHGDGYSDDFINAVLLSEAPQHIQFTTLLNLPSFDVEGDFFDNHVVIWYPGIIPVSDGPDVPVKDLTLLKLKPVGQPAIAFTYQDNGADGDFWITRHLQEAVLAPTDMIQAGEAVDLYLAVADNGDYDLDDTITVIVDPLVLGRLVVTAVPLAPASLSYPTSSDTGSYSVTWPASIGAESYRLEYSSDGGALWSHRFTGGDRSHVESLGSGSYRYRVRASNVAGDSPWQTGTHDLVVAIAIASDLGGGGSGGGCFIATVKK